MAMPIGHIKKLPGSEYKYISNRRLLPLVLTLALCLSLPAAERAIQFSFIFYHSTPRVFLQRFLELLLFIYTIK
jgi:hypothetical protein